LWIGCGNLGFLQFLSEIFSSAWTSPGAETLGGRGEVAHLQRRMWLLVAALRNRRVQPELSRTEARDRWGEKASAASPSERPARLSLGTLPALSRNRRLHLRVRLLVPRSSRLARERRWQPSRPHRKDGPSDGGTNGRPSRCGPRSPRLIGQDRRVSATIPNGAV
jgi:hypothetical protein